jgi:integrating conjugative element protein (TIGR03755 family)
MHRTKHGLVTTASVLAGLMAMPIHAAGQPTVPGDRSILYYKIGGGEPVSRPANPNTTTLKIGLAGTARLNYSCGRFDAGITIENLMNGFSKLGTAISGAVKAGIAALPMYIFQRASPGLYELFQTYQKKAETEWNIALKSCEEMEAQIKQGGDPYAEWLSMAKGEHWKDESKATQDAAEAKRRVETDGGTKGLTWIGGVRKGGRNQDAIEVIRDITQAGYNVTLNKPPAAPATAVYPPTTKLAAAFPSPKVAADWAVSVIGDRQIALCDEVGCQAKSSTPGSGLLPKYEAERPTVDKQLQAVVNSPSAPPYLELEKASAPGVAITRELIEALRALRHPDRQIVIERLAMEIAQARIVDKALMVRNVLLTGGGVPEAGWEPAQKELRERVDQLNRHMDDLLFETRMRREVVSTTARDVLEVFRAERAQSTSTRQQEGVDQRPMENGRVQ